MTLKDSLDKRVCDVEPDAGNTQTYREFIKEAEEEFGLEPLDLDIMSEKSLQKYLDFCDDLWSK